MIINNFLGGLGNQLFQIAAGFSHASLIGSDFAINYDLGIGFGQGHNPKRYKNNIYSRIIKLPLGYDPGDISKDVAEAALK